MLAFFLLTIFAELKITVLNPTSSVKWAPGKDVNIVWSLDGTVGTTKITLNLMDGSTGNQDDAPLIKEIAADVDPNLKKLPYKVPDDVSNGSYFIQIIPNDGKPQYSSTFKVEGGSSSAQSTCVVPVATLMTVTLTVFGMVL